MSVNIVKESGPQFKKPGTPRCDCEQENRWMRSDNPRNGVVFCAICFCPKHNGRHLPEAGLLTRRSQLNRLAFPFRRTVACCAGRSLLTVAGPTRGFSPPPFSSAFYQHPPQPFPPNKHTPFSH